MFYAFYASQTSAKLHVVRIILWQIIDNDKIKRTLPSCHVWRRKGENGAKELTLFLLGLVL